MLPRSSEQPESPRKKAGRLNALLFCWVIPIFLKGYRKKDLELTDIYRVLPEDETKVLADQMEASWLEQVAKTEKKNQNKDPTAKKYKPSLIKALFKIFAPRMAFYGIFAFVEENIFKLVQPIILGSLLDFFHSPDKFEEYQGYLFALGVLLCSIAYASSDHPFTFAVQHMGMQMRVCLCSLIYRKSLRVSKYALEQTTAGQVVNFLSSDMNRFDIFFTFFHYLWVAPIQIAIVIVILYFYIDLGLASLSSLVLIFFFVPFQGYMGYMFSKLRAEVADKTDARLLVLEEILSAIRVIKMYTWEQPFSDVVSETRRAEVEKLTKTAMYKCLNQSIFSVTSRTTLFLTVIAYILTGHVLTAKKVYMTLSLYATVQAVMTLFFPMAVISLAEVLVAIRRIRTFLLLDERNVPDAYIRDCQNERVRRYDWRLATSDDRSITSEYTYTTASFDSTSSTYADVCVTAFDMSAQWNANTKDMCFKNISFEVKAGQILALIGPTASGKSSVLNSLLYELPINSGSFRTIGKVSYSSQEPWVFNGSVRENILFGKPYNSAWYDQVTEACALSRDFQLLPYGDRTLVGEKGTALSGGQKARVTLARAVYSDADIYLLDDPLSAVDAQVGRQIMENCIMGILKNKCRILVTNQLQHVKHTDQVMLLIDGNVAYQGDYKTLQKSGIPFSELLNPELPPHPPPGKQSDAISIKTIITRESVSAIGAGANDKTPAMDVVPVKVGVTTLEEPEETEEFMASGSIDFSTFWRYFSAGATTFKVLGFILLTIFTQILFTGADLWLQFWVDTESHIQEGTLKLSKRTFIRVFQQNYNARIIFYTCLIVAIFLSFLIRTRMFYMRCMGSSTVIYDRLFYGILRSPMRFFETTSVGRILNRFAKDISIIDENLPQAMYDCLEIAMQTSGILFLILSNSFSMLFPSLLLLICFFYMRKFYFRTARSIKRLEGVARSPIFNHLSATLGGLPTIRAFGVEEKFIRDFETVHDIHTSVWYLFLASNRWFAITVDWVINCFIGGVLMNCLLNMDGAGDALVGVSVTSAIMMTSMVQWGMRQSTEMENHLIAFERVDEYCNLPSEAALDSLPDKKPPPDWPQKGEIKIQNMCLRYDPNAPTPVLKNITLTINPSEKVGIVGRTGAGKSSLISVLFRLAEPTSGYIEIDGVETTSIGLHDLRSKISIIPQEPVIFMGTVRGNLDPFSQYTDGQMWNALQEVKLVDVVRLMEGGLDAEITEGGSNFSAGQKQLFCLARAILQSNKILVLDEATANIDPETDRRIQKTIRKNFGECTILTIAHRLHTVMDSDRILVLQAGQVMEFDEPHVLLNNRHSILYQMVAQTGKAEASHLAQIAKIAALKRRTPVVETGSRISTRSRSSTSSYTTVNADWTGDNVIL